MKRLDGVEKEACRSERGGDRGGRSEIRRGGVGRVMVEQTDGGGRVIEDRDDAMCLVAYEEAMDMTAQDAVHSQSNVRG